MARTTQRSVMRDIYRHFDGNHDKVVAAYAAAERLGQVGRASNIRGMESAEYAERLFRDGVRRDWIR